MTRICIISPAAYPLITDSAQASHAGGAEIQLVTLGYALASRGYDVDFIVNDFGQPDHQVIDGVGIHKVPLRHMGGSSAYLPADFIRFLSVLAGIDADIHLIKLPRHMLLPLGLYARVRGKKTVFIGQVDGDANASQRKSTDRRVATWMYRAGLLMTDAIVAQTNVQKVGFESYFKREVSVIRNILTMKDERVGDKGNYVLWVGNSGRHKQPELFLRLARALPEYQFRMIMSPSAQRPSDEFIRDDLGDIPNLEYLGFVPFREMSDHYKRATILVSTSESEGFPNTFLQSWQFGTPTVSLNIDPDGVIDRFGLGRLSKSFDRLVDDVRTLMEDSVQRARLGSNAVEYALRNHSEDAVIGRYIALFDRMGIRG